MMEKWLLIKDPDGNTIFDGPQSLNDIKLDYVQYAVPTMKPVNVFSFTADPAALIDNTYDVVYKDYTVMYLQKMPEPVSKPAPEYSYDYYKNLYMNAPLSAAATKATQDYVRNIDELRNLKERAGAGKLTEEERDQIATVLEKAVEVLDRDGWTKGRLHK